MLSLEPLDPVAETRTTLRFAGLDHPDVTGLDDEIWWPGIARVTSLSREVFNGNFDGTVALAQANVEIEMQALKKADPDSPALRWPGAPVTVWRGEIGAAFGAWTKLFQGQVDSYGFKDGKMQIAAKVNSEPFEQNILDATYAGDGLAEGGEDIRDKVKPALFGYCRNVEPVLINAVDNVFQVHGYGSIEDVVMVFERAAEFGPSVGDFGSYAALVAAAIPEGEWGTCLAEGMFRLGAPPAGVITADVKGDNVGGFHQSTAQIIERLCDLAAVDAARIDAASLAAFETAVPYPINIYLTTPNRLIDLIQQLCLPCNAHAALSWAGTLQITRFDGVGTASLTLDAQGRSLPAVLSNEELTVSPPWWRIEMQAEKNWRVQNKDEIATFGEDGLWIRSPTNPGIPTGTEAEQQAAGWSEVPPEFSEPTADGDHGAFGPVWFAGRYEDSSFATPSIQDSLYKGWVIKTTSSEAFIEGGSNAIRLAPGSSEWAFYYIDQPITGPCALRCRVKGVADRIAMGVCPYDPGDFAADNGDVGDIASGFWLAQNDDFEVDDNGAPVTGVFPINDYDPECGLLNGANNKMAEPAAGLMLEVIYNGETFEFYVGGVLVRTMWFDAELDGDTFWPVFILVSDEAQIDEIEWFRATTAKTLPVPSVTYMQGPLRRTQDGKGLEWYTPFGSFGGLLFGGILYLGRFEGGAELAVEVVTPNAGTLVVLDNAGVLEMPGDGTVDFISGVTTVRDTQSVVAGDKLLLNYRKKRIRGYKNGVRYMKKKVGSGISSDAYLEWGPDASLKNIAMVGQVDEDAVIKGTASTVALTTPITQASPTVSVSGNNYVVVASLSIPFNPSSVDEDDLSLTAALTYANDAASAVNFTPATLLQTSVNGTTWTTFTSTQTPSSATAATPGGASQSLSRAGTADTFGSTGTIQIRFLVRNTVGGTFTATLSGSVAAEWQG